MASVTFANVSKVFADTVAVKDFSLHVGDKEFMVLVGPSGCGKSTLLRMLAGLEDITTGVIKIDDEVVNHVPVQRRDIAMVFQSYALYPQMTVFDNMAFGLKMRGMRRSDVESRVTDTAKMLGLETLLKRKPRQLSGGQRQRVALGRAIVRNPRVFLLDEPLSNLDAQLRVETRINLQRLHKRLGVTFIYVTHDQVEAMTMADRIALMKGGVLQQVAPPMELYEHPANMYVAGFIGSPRMNFVPVALSGKQAVASAFELCLPRSFGVSRAVLGIRPDALREGPGSDDPTMDVLVDLVEVLGSDRYIYGRAGADEIAARVSPALSVRTGEYVRLGIDVQRVHVFDPVTENVLS